MSTKKHSTALVIGRFQPFHKGHLYLVRKALNQAENIIIAIGSSNVSDEENPLSYQTRKKILEKVLRKENLQDKVSKIIPSPDHSQDEEWLRLLLKNTGHFDIVVGNNDWTNRVLKANHYKVKTVPYLKRQIFQGKYIRDLYKQNKNWKSRVPDYLEDDISQALKKSYTHNM